jgi:hypothetical protein
VCPVCNGSGMLSKNQKRHWDDLSTDHTMKLCNDCNETILVCKCLH